MTDARHHTRDERGEWQPRIVTPAPWVQWPLKPLAVLKWLFGNPGYLLPWIAVLMLFPLVTWFFLTPDLARMKTFEVEWIVAVFLRNIGILILVAGGFHLHFYIQKTQGTRYKYNSHWPGEHRRFLFGHQTRDNVFWSIVSGCTIWTAYEVVTYWLFANGHIGFLNWADHPIYFVLLYLAVHPIREAHFYLTHRLLHWKPLYKSAHYLHHKNLNIGPWSGLSMHPIEHLIYFTGVILHWVLLSHPLHAIYHLQHTALTAPLGHNGFENLVTNGNREIKGCSDYFHYLHHRYFECNYGGTGVPLDKWFGTFHDGSAEAHEVMREKRKRIHG